jgi:hypothetical protein
MKIRFSHENGKYQDTTDSILCEAYATPENESFTWLFEHGWLPTVNGEWYQSKSSRLFVKCISPRRYEGNITVVHPESNWEELYSPFHNEYTFFDVSHASYLSSLSVAVLCIDSLVYVTLNLFDDIPYISCAIGSKRIPNINLYIPSICIEYLKNAQLNFGDYVYIGEYYRQFSFKSQYPCFEFWDGCAWKKNV